MTPREAGSAPLTALERLRLRFAENEREVAAAFFAGGFLFDEAARREMLIEASNIVNEELPVVVLIPHDALFQKSLSNLKEVESRGGRIIVVTDAPSPDLEEVAWEVLSVPKTSEFLTPLLLTVPLQLLAYHVAVYRGTDVDQPRNLAKSVTVE